MFSSDYEKVEQEVSGKQGSYQGLRAEALLTSEEDFKAIFKALPDIKIWVEPGSGHGLGPLLFAKLHPHAQAIGIEFEKSRFEISEKLKLQHEINNANFFHLDILHHDLPLGDAYFLYFPTGMVLDRILHQLARREDSFLIIAVESHGDLLPRLKKETWLKEISQIPLSQARHHNHALVFTNEGSPSASLHDHSFKHDYFLIADKSGEEWIGESYNLEWQKEDQYLLQTPPRSIHSNQVKNVWRLDQIEARFHHALGLRRLGKLSFETESGPLEGSIRKIIVSPSFKLEISSGQQVEWSQITKIFWENTLCFDTSSDYSYLPHVV